MYEARIVKDGDPAFGIEGTFQIHDTIYVLTEEGDFHLLNRLTDFGYQVRENENRHDSHGEVYIAVSRHIRTKSEIIDEHTNAVGRATNANSTYIVDMNYKGKPKISLEDPNVHNVIISISSHSHRLDWYNRPHDQMSDVVISRMSGFVKNMVDVDFDLWKEFVEEARHYHAQDFIRRMAHWASQHSDQKPRIVAESIDRNTIIVGGKDFNLTKPLSIGGLRGGPFFRR